MTIVALWLAKLWGFQLPYLFKISGILFDSLLILTIALFTWQVLSSWIERKINESLPEEEEEEEDSEWGGAASRGRSYTLLPMLRKFMGTVLVPYSYFSVTLFSTPLRGEKNKKTVSANKAVRSQIPPRHLYPSRGH